MLIARKFLRIADFVNGPADSIEQCSTAADIILFIRDWLDSGDIDSVMQQFVFIIEKHCGDNCVPRFFLLPGNHGVKATDCIFFESGHRSALIQDEHQFG